MFVHRIVVDEKNYKRLKKLVAEIKKTGLIDHSFGHNNSRTYMIYATKDLSELFRNWGFFFTARQI